MPTLSGKENKDMAEDLHDVMFWPTSFSYIESRWEAYCGNPLTGFATP